MVRVIPYFEFRAKPKTKKERSFRIRNERIRGFILKRRGNQIKVNLKWKGNDHGYVY